MDDERRNMLTRETLKEALLSQGEIKIVSAEEYRRSVGRFAKKLDISLEEAFVFLNPIVKEMFEEMIDQSQFDKKDTSSDKKHLTGKAFRDK
ncbi:MAG: hypothetical protein KAS02_01020 [Candidatus Pacebacteria bacterium]|nr:hypothetical protein [Candidatus Paceibacterota bacterium]